MVNEIKSYSDPSLRDNARIAYEKALELNPESVVIKEAAKAMAGGFARSDQKVIHLIGSIGMAPEKARCLLWTASAGAGDGDAVEVSDLYRSTGYREDDRGARQHRSAKARNRLSALADIEAMAIRYQKDRLPVESVKFGIAASIRVSSRRASVQPRRRWRARSATWRDQSINPDMRAWLALPARFHAARLVVPANLIEDPTSLLRCERTGTWAADGRSVTRHPRLCLYPRGRQGADGANRSGFMALTMGMTGLKRCRLSRAVALSRAGRSCRLPVAATTGTGRSDHHRCCSRSRGSGC